MVNKMAKKYEPVLEDTIEFFGRKLFRIRAKISFGIVEKGELEGTSKAKII